MGLADVIQQKSAIHFANFCQHFQKALPIGRIALDLLASLEKAGALPAQRLGQLLSRTAFELRRIGREGNVQNGNAAAIQQCGNAKTIWLRIRLLVEVDFWRLAVAHVVVSVWTR